MTPVQVGIHALGFYLPEVVRKNDWWPRATVERWEEKLAVKKMRRGDGPQPSLPEGARKAIAALAEYADDPFKGAKERRVMPDGMLPSDMEIAAARDALTRAQIDPKEIDLLITFSQLPDYLTVPTAPAVHAALGLNEWCLSLSIDSACNSFPTQLSLAEQMIQGGRARRALLVQSSALMHLIRPEEQHSAWFGDGATAAVVGPVGEEKGILATCHRTDDSFYKALVGGCPNGGRWFDGKEITYYIKDRDAAVRMALSLPELGKQVVEKALGEAGYRADQVDFYASHQGTHWLRRVTQEHIGLNLARYFDSYEFTTSLTASNLPFVMAMGEREGILRDGDLVAMFTGGSGITVSGTVLRWGR